MIEKQQIMLDKKKEKQQEKDRLKKETLMKQRTAKRE